MLLVKVRLTAACNCAKPLPTFQEDEKLSQKRESMGCVVWRANNLQYVCNGFLSSRQDLKKVSTSVSAAVNMK